MASVHEWENEHGELLVFDDGYFTLTHSDADTTTEYQVPPTVVIDGLVLSWEEVKTLADIIVGSRD